MHHFHTHTQNKIYSLTLSELASPFDSIYISFYKGLGALSGAMLLGTNDFCAQARIWLRRFGGNLYTLVPYAVSAWSGYRNHWTEANNNAQTKDADDDEGGRRRRKMTFVDKRNKLRRIVRSLQQNPLVSQYITFDPHTPETNMVHGYIQHKPLSLSSSSSSLGSSKAFLEECHKIKTKILRETGICVFHRLKPIVDEKEEGNEQEHEHEKPVTKIGYGAKFEWVMGDANGAIDDEIYMRGWNAFASGLLQVGGE